MRINRVLVVAALALLVLSLLLAGGEGPLWP